MNQSVFEEVKRNIVFLGNMSRCIRMSNARMVYLGSNLEENARWLVMRTMDAMFLYETLVFSKLDEEQQSELVSLAKDTLRQFFPLPKENAKHMNGTQIHDMLSSR